MVDFVLNEQNAKQLVDDIKCLSSCEHDQILDCIKKDNIRYMENDNGIFIKFNDMKMTTIQTIYDFVRSIRESQQMQYQGSIFDVENKLYDYDDGKHLEEKDNEIQKDKKKHITEDWKKEVIMKMKSEVKQKHKKRGKTIEISV